METNTSKLRLPYSSERVGNRGITRQMWGVLINSTFPGVTTEDAILNAWDLAKVRGLDVFSGHIAIVSKRRKIDNTWVNEESCWLTLKALVFTAHKTGVFAGIAPIEFGPIVEHTFTGSRWENEMNVEKSVTLQAPEYVTATVNRFVSGERCSFSDTLFFEEAVPLVQGLPTPVWEKKPTLMLAKCAKAAALRLGFAECDYSADEMEGQDLASDVVPDQDTSLRLVPSDPAGSAMPEVQHQTASSGRMFDSETFDETVTSFDKLPAKTLQWLDRNVDTAISIGAFDDAVANMRSTLDADTHDLGERLIRAAEKISAHPKGLSLWDFIGKARAHGGDAFDAAINQISAKAGKGQLPEDLSEASGTTLTFLKALNAA